MVEASRFYLVERLAAEVAAISMADPRVEAARKRLRSRRALAVRATWPRRRDRADGAELHRHLGGRTSDAVRRTCNGSSAEELASEVAAPVFMTVGMATNPTFTATVRTPLRWWTLGGDRCESSMGSAGRTCGQECTANH